MGDARGKAVGIEVGEAMMHFSLKPMVLNVLKKALLIEKCSTRKSLCRTKTPRSRALHKPEEILPQIPQKNVNFLL